MVIAGATESPLCLLSAGPTDTTSSNQNIFLLEVMSSLEKALIALRILPVERKQQPSAGACHLGMGPNLVLWKVMRIFTGFRLLFIPLDSRHP